MSGKLTPKQEDFCRIYVENGGNATDAYRRAYQTKDWTENALNVQASKMLKHPKIVLRVEQLQAGHSKRHNITVDDLISELDEARQVALASPRGASAAVSATMGKAKLLGLVVDRAELTGKDGGPIQAVTASMTPQEAAEAYAATLKKVGG